MSFGWDSFIIYLSRGPIFMEIKVLGLSYVFFLKFIIYSLHLTWNLGDHAKWEPIWALLELIFNLGAHLESTTGVALSASIARQWGGTRLVSSKGCGGQEEYNVVVFGFRCHQEVWPNKEKETSWRGNAAKD